MMLLEAHKNKKNKTIDSLIKYFNVPCKKNGEGYEVAFKYTGHIGELRLYNSSLELVARAYNVDCKGWTTVKMG